MLYHRPTTGSLQYRCQINAYARVALSLHQKALLRRFVGRLSRKACEFGHFQYGIPIDLGARSRFAYL